MLFSPGRLFERVGPAHRLLCHAGLRETSIGGWRQGLWRRRRYGPPSQGVDERAVAFGVQLGGSLIAISLDMIWLFRRVVSFLRDVWSGRGATFPTPSTQLVKTIRDLERGGLPMKGLDSSLARGAQLVEWIGHLMDF